MKVFKLFYLFLILSLQLLYTSCNTNDISTEDFTEAANLASLMPQGIIIPQGITCLDEKSNGIIILESMTSVDIQDDPYTLVKAKFYDETGNLTENGTLSLDLNTTNFQTLQNVFVSGDTELRDLYGSTVTINLSQSTRFDVEKTMYVPELLKITQPNQKDGFLEFNGTSLLNWNADSNNQFDIAIGIRFDPTGLGNKAFGDLGYEEVVNIVQTIDDGVYNITSDDMAGIPQGATVSLNLVRANCNSLINGVFNTSIIAFSHVQGRFLCDDGMF